MRINQYLAHASGISRRAADKAILSGRVDINGERAHLGQDVTTDDLVYLDNQVLRPPKTHLTIILNKPVGFVCSRNGQGSKTIYDLLPLQYHQLKSVGRLDKDSSGLLLLTNDGHLSNELAHPGKNKLKVYKVKLDRPLTIKHIDKLKKGVKVEDYVSHLTIINHKLEDVTIQMTQGKNRQIRKTYAALGFRVVKLHRTKFGPYLLGDLKTGNYAQVTDDRTSVNEH